MAHRLLGERFDHAFLRLRFPGLGAFRVRRLPSEAFTRDRPSWVLACGAPSAPLPVMDQRVASHLSRSVARRSGSRMNVISRYEPDPPIQDLVPEVDRERKRTGRNHRHRSPAASLHPRFDPARGRRRGSLPVHGDPLVHGLGRRHHGDAAQCRSAAGPVRAGCSDRLLAGGKPGHDDPVRAHLKCGHQVR